MNLLLVDDHQIIRDGLKRILQFYYPGIVISEAGSAEVAFEMIASSEFDLIISDYSLPGKSGLDLIKFVLKEKPGVPVLILSMHPEEQYGLPVLKAGAAGYINKTAGADIIIEAINTVMDGKTYLTEKLKGIIMDT